MVSIMMIIIMIMTTTEKINDDYVRVKDDVSRNSRIPRRDHLTMLIW